MTRAIQGGVKIFLLNHGQVKQLMYDFIPSPKKEMSEIAQKTIPFH